VISRAQELCRQLKPVLGKKIGRLWSVYLAESDPAGKRDIEQTLELLAAKHLQKTYEPDHNPFPPPSKQFAQAGDIKLGHVHYAGKELYPFLLKSRRLKEHVLIAGRSGSGKTNLTFILAEEMMKAKIKVLALDWKRGYRDLLSRHRDMRVYTIGRDVSPFRFNPLIPPPGCEPHLWIKMIVDVIANSYLGGEGVISLLVAGLDHLYRKAGVFDTQEDAWPTIQDLLIWLKTAKLKGRAAMWQASAERILLAMMYGEFGAVLNTQDNSHVSELLQHNVVLEMDGLSSASDKVMFSEALTLYLYRYRLAQGPQQKLTNMIILEEAHNLLLKKASESRESILETSIRMIRQYGMGYVFVDQSASLLSKVAFANSYATIALSQKLRSDVQTITGAMNLIDEQKQALNTLEIGTAIVRLADEHPQAFLVKIPLSPIKEGIVSDTQIQALMGSCYSDSGSNKPPLDKQTAITAVPAGDKNNEIIPERDKTKDTHPPSPKEADTAEDIVSATDSSTPSHTLNRQEIRFLHDVAADPLATTVSRYQRLNLSRRKGNAIRHSLLSGKLIEPVTLATRSGQVVLYQLTDHGRTVCETHQIDPGPVPRESLEHQWWIRKAKAYFEKQSYEVTPEHPVKGNGAIDLLAVKPGEKIAIEVETGKSNIKQNLLHLKKKDFDKLIMVATSPDAVSACQKAIDVVDKENLPVVELWTWLDI
jgi:hypothetical protein